MPPDDGATDHGRSVKEWASHIRDLIPVDMGAAVRAAKLATELHPEAASLASLKAEIILERGHRKDADKALNIALKLPDMDDKSRLRLIRVAIALGRLDMAVRLIRKALAAERSGEHMATLLEQLISVGDYGLAHEQRRRPFGPEPDPRLKDLFKRAAVGVARDRAWGVGPRAKRRWFKAMEQLRAGRPESAEPHFERLTRAAPPFNGAWIGLRGALSAQGRTEQAAAVADAWALAAPESATVIQTGMRRKLSPRGLLFDPLEPIPMAPKEQLLRRVASADDLKSADNAFLVLDPGGRVLEHAPAFSFDDRASQPIRVTVRTPEVFLASVRNPMLVGRGVVVTEDGVIIEDLTPGNPSKFEARLDDRGMMFDPGQFKDGLCEIRYFDTPAFLLAGPTDHSFGDWMINFPPKLALAQAAALDCPVVIAERFLPQTVDMLAALGVAPDRLIFHDGEGVSIFPKLYAPSWPMIQRLQHPEDVFDIYRRAARPGRQTPGPRLYLSREGVGKRNLTNEPEVRALFEARGFEVVHPERLSFAQTLETFANPSCVAAPYGSALLNLVFSDRTAACLVLAAPEPELFIREATSWLGALGLKFGYVRGLPLDASAVDESSPWTIPLTMVSQALDQLLDLIDG